ncbi:hypothetical protein Lal_00019295, partial [Lupinus albus]
YYYKDKKLLQSKAILASTIEIVGQINEYVLNKILGKEEEYVSSDTSDANKSKSFNIYTNSRIFKLTYKLQPLFFPIIRSS